MGAIDRKSFEATIQTLSKTSVPHTRTHISLKIYECVCNKANKIFSFMDLLGRSANEKKFFKLFHFSAFLPGLELVCFFSGAL